MRFARCRLFPKRIEIRIDRNIRDGQWLLHAHGQTEISIQVSRLVEVDHRREIMLTNGLTHCCMKDGIHQLDFQEVDFRFRRMDVDVDVRWVHFDIQEISREAVLRDHLHVCVLDGMVQISVLDKALVHKEILLASGLLGKLRFDDVTLDAHTLGLLLDRQQSLFVIGAKQAHNALLEIARIEMIQFLAVAGQCKANFRIHQRDASKFLHDMPQFSLRRFEEVAPCGHVEKQVLNGERRARLHGNQGLLLDHRALVDNLHPHFVLLASGLQFHLRYGGDAGQGLASETHSADGKQVFRLANFGSGMTLEAQAGIRFRHTAAIVDHHNHRLTGVFHYQVDLGGTSIQSVLHQLFDRRCWTLNHLACRNLVGDAIGKQFDYIYHWTFEVFKFSHSILGFLTMAYDNDYDHFYQKNKASLLGWRGHCHSQQS